jgi:hypothetical protein
MKNNKLLFLILLLLVTAGCSKDDDDNRSPSERILGKWQEIACGNEYYPELSSTYHVFQTIEFLPDGTYNGSLVLSLSWDDGVPSQYRIASDSLHLKREGYHDDYIYRYIFTGKDRLFVEHIYGQVHMLFTTPSFHIFKRIK